jgi:tRNA-Thr(GGU) m(6)t(6)A37 methyltransferase TsaA
VVRTPFKEPRGTPIQPSAGKDVKGKVEIFEEFAEGLKDLDGFSHIILLFHLHLSKDRPLRVIPYMDDVERGVFSTRAPARPNPIGMSIVRVDKIEGRVIFVRDLDIVDGTPLLDIKPFVPEFGPGDDVRIGWLEKRVSKLPSMRDDGRFED